jgi:hypothetical protein
MQFPKVSKTFQNAYEPCKQSPHLICNLLHKVTLCEKFQKSLYTSKNIILSPEVWSYPAMDLWLQLGFVYPWHHRPGDLYFILRPAFGWKSQELDVHNQQRIRTITVKWAVSDCFRWLPSVPSEREPEVLFFTNQYKSPGGNDGIVAVWPSLHRKSLSTCY